MCCMLARDNAGQAVVAPCSRRSPLLPQSQAHGAPAAVATSWLCAVRSSSSQPPLLHRAALCRRLGLQGKLRLRSAAATWDHIMRQMSFSSPPLMRPCCRRMSFSCCSAVR